MDLFEYNDILNSPVEAFYCSDSSFQLPVRLHWHYFVEMLYVDQQVPPQSRPVRY